MQRAMTNEATHRGRRDEDGALHRLDPERLNDHAGRLYRAAYALCGSRQDAEDLVQDTYERILRRPRFVRHDGDLGYLVRVLHNTWATKCRARRLIAVPMDSEVTDSIPDPRGDAAVDSLRTSEAYEALRELSLPLREALVAVDVVGLSYRDAARALGTKEGTIMSRLHRGRSQVAARLRSSSELEPAADSREREARDPVAA